jgi:regulatory protein
VPGSGADLTPDADPEQVARSICLRQLALAPRTRSQLAETLANRLVPAGAAEVVLDRFVAVGLIDDAAYAEAWVRSRQAGRGLARSALARELKDRGVQDDLVAGAIDRVSADDERAAARRLVERKLASTSSLDDTARTRRLMGMLARKGYAPGLAWSVIREVLHGSDAGTPDT